MVGVLPARPEFNCAAVGADIAVRQVYFGVSGGAAVCGLIDRSAITADGVVNVLFSLSILDVRFDHLYSVQSTP